MVVDSIPSEEVEHTHIHKYVDGERSFTHSHPLGDHMDPKLGAKKHSHSNGSHIHPHNHKGYDRD